MSCPKKSAFHKAPDIRPLTLRPGMTVAEFLDAIGTTCFEARVITRGARLFARMVDEGDTIWLGIAGAGVAGGLGGPVVQLIERGAVDIVCTTGAQAYHDLHFAFELPVKAISPTGDDDALRRSGDTRIYDIGIREEETLEAQDALIRRFVRERYDQLSASPLTSPRFMKLLGDWTLEVAPRPDCSFVAAAAKADVPVFWDSFTNHSIAMNLARLDGEGFPLVFSPQEDILCSAALAFGEGVETGFIELGGGGPKNFIQQTGPTISQILGLKDFEGASRGLQISTANIREGSLSSCTFGEAVTWGKYEAADEDKLVQIWAEYSYVFPMLTQYVLERSAPRPLRRLMASLPERRRLLGEAASRA